MRGIVLAGGKGTRLYPITKSVSKQLLPVYDKPMIYYPISTLILGGIREIAIISTPRDLELYRELLGTGKKWGLSFKYFEQKKPTGLPDAFLVCKDFISDDNVALILGDNIFYGNMRLDELFQNFNAGSLIFGYTVDNPERYGVIEFDEQGNILGIEEKPTKPKSNYIVPGLYLYDSKVVGYASELKPSKRGELEITDLNMKYLEGGNLRTQIIGRGVAWLDAGRAEDIQEAGNFIRYVEKRQSYKIACIEEICFRKGFIDYKQYVSLINEIPISDYRDYLISLKSEFEIYDSSKIKNIKKLQP